VIQVTVKHQCPAEFSGALAFQRRWSATSMSHVTLNIPVYLEPENQAFVEQIAKKKKLDISRVVNELIKSDIQLAKVLE
jgi:hypothetical protein